MRNDAIFGSRFFALQRETRTREKDKRRRIQTSIKNNNSRKTYGGRPLMAITHRHTNKNKGETTRPQGVKRPSGHGRNRFFSFLGEYHRKRRGETTFSPLCISRQQFTEIAPKVKGKRTKQKKKYRGVYCCPRPKLLGPKKYLKGSIISQVGDVNTRGHELRTINSTPPAYYTPITTEAEPTRLDGNKSKMEGGENEKAEKHGPVIP